MPRCDHVERRIFSLEGFEVIIRKADGSNMRDDMVLRNTYSYTKAAPGDWTVNEWIENRFKRYFNGYDVSVLMGDGRVAAGQMKLKTVRDSY